MTDSTREPIDDAVLVVDDSAFMRKRICEALRQNGYIAVEVSNGSAALDAMAQREFVCVLTDLVMPELDGFALLEEVQKRRLKVPVVVLTADVQRSTRDRCYSLGARALLQKPINPIELRSVMSGVVGEHN